MREFKKKKIVKLSIATVVIALTMLYGFHLSVLSIHELSNSILVNEYHQNPKEFVISYKMYSLAFIGSLCLVSFVVYLVNLSYVKKVSRNNGH